MKRIPLALFTCLTAFSLHAQLAGTKWTTKINTGELLNVIFDFDKTTCYIYRMADSGVIETMNYTIKDSLITLHKIDGQSDCDTSTPGVYAFHVKNNTLNLILFKDDCDDRSSTVDNTHWQPWVIPADVKVDEAILKQYCGTYALDLQHPIYVTFADGHLWIEGPNNGVPKTQLITESATRFFIRLANVHWDFVKDAAGNVIKVISHEEKDYELAKIK